MILDRLKNCYTYFSPGQGFEAGFKFILENDLSQFADGKYEIDGENVFALVSSYATKSAAEKLPEAHRKYADIQCMISGYENVGYAHLGSQKVTTDYNDEKDIIFYDEVSFYFNLQEGSFTVFLPDDIHMPGIIDDEAMEVRKVVVKVRL